MIDHWPFEVLRFEGFMLSLDGDRLMVAPADLIDAETRSYIVAHRAALVESCRAVAAMFADFAAHNAGIRKSKRGAA